MIFAKRKSRGVCCKMFIHVWGRGPLWPPWTRIAAVHWPQKGGGCGNTLWNLWMFGGFRCPMCPSQHPRQMPNSNVDQCPMVLGAPPTTLAAVDSAEALPDQSPCCVDGTCLVHRPERCRRNPTWLFIAVVSASPHPRNPPPPPTARASASEKTLQSARGKTWREQTAKSCGQLQFGTNFLSVQKATLGRGSRRLKAGSSLASCNLELVSCRFRKRR